MWYKTQSFRFDYNIFWPQLSSFCTGFKSIKYCQRWPMNPKLATLLVGLLVGLLIGLLIGILIGLLVGLLIGLLIDYNTNYNINYNFSQSINESEIVDVDNSGQR